MRYQRLISALRPDSAARLPALLAAVLLLCLGAQLLLPSETELPPPLPVGRAGAVVTPPAVQIAAPADGLLARPLFAPRTAAGATGPGGQAPSALGGAVVAGTVSMRGAARAVVRRADGSVGYLPVGGAIAGWRLVRLDADRALFRKGSERLSLAYGSAAPPVEVEDEASEEEGE